MIALTESGRLFQIADAAIRKSRNTVTCYAQDWYNL